MPTTLITGSNRGIGLELARQYAGDGWRVHATCRRPDGAQELARVAEGAAGRVRVHELDVTDGARITGLAETLADESIDVLIQNAGLHGGRDTPAAEVDHDEWAEVMRVNAMAPLRVTAAFADHVARSEQRRVVMITSLMGSISDIAEGGNYVYRSSKAAANSVMRGLSFELAPRGIVVVALHPGWVRTDMGGPEAPLTVEESVTGCRAVIAGLTREQSGTFLDHRGAPIPW